MVLLNHDTITLVNIFILGSASSVAVFFFFLISCWPSNLFENNSHHGSVFIKSSVPTLMARSRKSIHPLCTLWGGGSVNNVQFLKEDGIGEFWLCKILCGELEKWNIGGCITEAVLLFSYLFIIFFFTTPQLFWHYFPSSCAEELISATSIVSYDSLHTHISSITQGLQKYTFQG